jgi:hypothetical protein
VLTPIRGELECSWVRLDLPFKSAQDRWRAVQTIAGLSRWEVEVAIAVPVDAASSRVLTGSGDRLTIFVFDSSLRPGVDHVPLRGPPKPRASGNSSVPPAGIRVMGMRVVAAEVETVVEDGVEVSFLWVSAQCAME